jgi:hypothetical protein
MKTVVYRILEMVNNRSDNSLKTKFTEDEFLFWMQQEKKQIIDAFEYGEYTYTVRKRLDYNHEDYKFNNSDEYYYFNYRKSCSQAE